MEKNFIGTDVNQVKITNLSHIRGQPQVIDNLEVNLRAHFNIRTTSGSSDSSFGPTILCGSPGTGKTLVAQAIHSALGNLKLIETNGETVNNKRELFSILINANNYTTFFIDEAQALNSKAQHILLTAISEKKLYVSAGITSACSYTIPLANFTFIMATTHEYQISDALRNRMRIYCRFNYYSQEDLIEIVRQRADALNWRYESDEVLRIIAQAAKRTPRLALHRNLQTCWHVTRSHDRDVITLADAYEAFCHLQIDDLGLDQLDRSYLKTLLEHGRLSLGVLSSKLSLPTLTIQRVVEPYLLKEDFITKDKSSFRVITPKGVEHIKNSSLPLKG
jgi:holliday junction DNA helicase RuvB